MVGTNLLKELHAQIIAEKLLPSDGVVVVAVSGGADSMCLLHVLVTLNQQADFALDLHIAHLNHGLRDREAEDDAAFVQAAADGYSLPCTIESMAIGNIAKAQQVSLEEAARNERYRFFERVCRQTGAHCVALGHQADDNVETVLQRILRGTGLRGLAGIPRCRPLHPTSDIRLVRPLLGYNRQVIIAINNAHAVPYREDASNASNEPLRNRLRNVILPSLAEQVNPQVREALLRLAEQARWVNEYVDRTAQSSYETLIIEHTDQELSLNADALARKDRIIQAELVRRAIASFELGEQDISFAHLSMVVDLLADKASGKQVHLPGAMTVSKIYHRLVFAVPTDQPRETIAEEIVIHVPGRTTLTLQGVELTCELVDLSAEEAVTAMRARHVGEEWLDYDALRPPLTVRHRRAGDRFWPLGAPGSKKVSEFLIDAKVTPDERDRLALLCDRLGPVWLVGYRIDERVRLTRQTRRALKVRACRID
ncbi:MAG: tRNA lysidine(34) synthetase TilS [Phycisphaerae bacterium]|nr:tRNA lysidine(34) synthetase TilS [Phycisphaerae bacterium]